MSKTEGKIEEYVREDAFLTENLAETELPRYLCLARIQSLRLRTDLLGSVEAVEEHFDQSRAGIRGLSDIASALSAAQKNFVSTTIALKKAIRAEKDMQRKEQQRLDKEKIREQARSERARNRQSQQQAQGDREAAEDAKHT